ncbi:hypothetical protein PF010_g20409 [Phytophthora fragariae]|nr:hypothetical protein PF003_g33324 [Phytophthora fragariae]KAE8928715.1 hypothetical protein PF009_g21158 [Phytophthora fragariae]KAE8986317.1 hypothetical protein PF011_g20038 [Phytophthora fragariae]KAE9085585.1 hypothetical protein PF010_g20409 [Phytophthora fragariae]KAE9115910.1 hypothetical protein PF006_g19171 [Phytophthora fragariae]
MVASVSLLPEAIQVIIAALGETKKGRVGLEDLREWLAHPASVDDEDSDEEEWSAEDNLQGDPTSARSLTGSARRRLLTTWLCGGPLGSHWKREKKITYYLVEWGPTWEPHLNQKVVATFEKERRRLVCKTFFEDKAVEDSTLNNTEG